MNGAVAQFQKAIELLPTSSEYRFNFGFALAANGDYAAALTPLQKAVELSSGKNARFLAELAEAYDKMGRFAEAVTAAQQALDLVVLQHNAPLEKNLRDALDGYQSDAAKAKPR
jgi:Flp pilus assembly protein TadD